MLIEDAIETLSFADVAVDSVGDFFGGEAEEMVRLALHGPDTSVLEE